jgi:hypothetical protein
MPMFLGKKEPFNPNAPDGLVAMYHPHDLSGFRFGILLFGPRVWPPN